MHQANALGSHVESSAHRGVRISTVLLAFRRQAKEFLVRCGSISSAISPSVQNLVPLDCTPQRVGSFRIAIRGPRIGPSRSYLERLPLHIG
jgi:hypothetical protein